MKQYRLNPLQYHVLSSILKVTQKDMALSIGVTEVTMSRHIQDGDFKVSEAIGLCNAYHIPLSCFVTEEEELHITPILRQEEWTPIRFSASRIYTMISDGNLNYSEIMRKMGVARKTIDTILGGKCKMSQLIDFCNSCEINLPLLVNDHTLPYIFEDCTSSLEYANNKLRRENEQLRRKIEMLERKLNDIIENRMEPYVAENK